jgi:hypothetical protein
MSLDHPKIDLDLNSCLDENEVRVRDSGPVEV